jgi:hypothetical protein
MTNHAEDRRFELTTALVTEGPEEPNAPEEPKGAVCDRQLVLPLDHQPEQVTA